MNYDNHHEYSHTPKRAGWLSVAIVLGLVLTAILINSIENPFLRNIAPVIAACVGGGLYKFTSDFLGKSRKRD